MAPDRDSADRGLEEGDGRMSEHDVDVAPLVTTAPGPLAWLLQLPIRLYRLVLAPIIPPCCRFYPSCSAYAMEALARHGAFRGLYLAARRLLRCGPWHPGGLDFVPDRFSLRVQRDTTSSPDDPDRDSSTQELP